VVKYIVSVIFNGFTDVLVNLLKARPSLGEPPAVPLNHVSDPKEFYRDHYIAPISYSSKLYSDLDISYFADLREKVHDGEKTLDKKRSGPDDGGDLIYAFAPMAARTAADSLPNQVSIAPSLASSSKCAHGAMGIVEVNSDSSDNEDDN
jgi:hypothetical protein